jgi:hypothetical protein
MLLKLKLLIVKSSLFFVVPWNKIVKRVYRKSAVVVVVLGLFMLGA